jgi:O-antigen ligase
LKEWGTEFNEWNSAFLYLTDLILAAIFFFWAVRRNFWFFEFKKWGKPKIIGILIIVFFLISGVSLIKAGNLALGAYQQLKLFEFFILFFYIKNNFGKFINFDFALKILFFSAIFQAILGIGQFTVQEDFGLKILGESPLGPNIDGAAKISASGVKMIRAYGTFPHPNILAVFLIFFLFCFYLAYLIEKESSFKKNIFLMSSFFIVVFGLFLTFSRVAIISFAFCSLMAFLILFFKKGFYLVFRKKVLILSAFFLLSVVVCLLFMQKEVYSRFVSNVVDPGINLRFFYNFISISMIKESPFLGIGEGNFVWSLKDHQGTLRAANLIYKIDDQDATVVAYKVQPWLYQPVHNIYLFIASENGIFALVVFLLILAIILFPAICIIKNNDPVFVLYLLFLIFCVISLTDHFFWTLQQGRLMFWVLAGILASFLQNKKVLSS